MDDNELATLQAILKAQHCLLIALAATHQDPGALLKEFSAHISRTIDLYSDHPRVHRYLIDYKRDISEQLRRLADSTSQSGL